MTYPATLLAIEASTAELSLALFKDSQLVAEESYSDGRGQHSLKLLPMLDQLLQKAGIETSQIDAFACTRGPGAFTSVRICLATTLGLAFPGTKPVYALNTIETMAENARGLNAAIMPMLDARKGEVYAALYQSDLPFTKPLLALQTANADEVVREALYSTEQNIICFGTGAKAYAERITALDPARVIVNTEIEQQPKASQLGKRILQMLKNGIETEAASPLYLRRPEAVVNLEKKLEEMAGK